VESFEKNNHN
jgi:hypothetical protein